MGIIKDEERKKIEDQILKPEFEEVKEEEVVEPLLNDHGVFKINIIFGVIYIVVGTALLLFT